MPDKSTPTGKGRPRKGDRDTQNTNTGQARGGDKPCHKEHCMPGQETLTPPMKETPKTPTPTVPNDSTVVMVLMTFGSADVVTAVAADGLFNTEPRCLELSCTSEQQMANHCYIF